MANIITSGTNKPQNPAFQQMMAKMLVERGTSTAPVYGWGQGLARVLAGIVGGYQGAKAQEQKEKYDIWKAEDAQKKAVELLREKRRIEDEADAGSFQRKLQAYNDFKMLQGGGQQQQPRLLTPETQKPNVQPTQNKVDPTLLPENMPQTQPKENQMPKFSWQEKDAFEPAYLDLPPSAEQMAQINQPPSAPDQYISPSIAQFPNKPQADAGLTALVAGELGVKPEALQGEEPPKLPSGNEKGGVVSHLQGAKLLQEAINLTKQNPRSSGGLGGLLTKNALYELPDNPQYDVNQLLDPVKSNEFLGGLAALKAASKTGSSGLGAVTEKEISALEKSYRSLDTGQSYEQRLAAMQDVQRRYLRVVALVELDQQLTAAGKVVPPDFDWQSYADSQVETQYSKMMQSMGQDKTTQQRLNKIGAPAPEQQEPQPTKKRLKWNRETGEFE